MTGRAEREAGGDADHFHARLTRQRTLVAQGTWFGDSPLIFRLGLAHDPADKLQKGLEAISDALARPTAMGISIR